MIAVNCIAACMRMDKASRQRPPHVQALARLTRLQSLHIGSSTNDPAALDTVDMAVQMSALQHLTQLSLRKQQLNPNFLRTQLSTLTR